MRMKLSELNKLVGGSFTGNSDIEIKRVAKIEEADIGDITFLANPKYKKHLSTTKASVILISHEEQIEDVHLPQPAPTFIRVSDPYRSFLKLLDLFHPAAPPLQGIHPAAFVSSTAVIGNDVAIGAFAVIGERCMIGDGTSIHHGAVLYEDVVVGHHSTLYANVTVREQCKLGNCVIIHSGTVIGSDGFGFAPKPDHTYEKIPQRGSVVIEDDVEIGANCAIDRATLGETRIKHGTKLDNLIHVAHNVVIGEDTAIAAQTGISGSTKIGNRCIIAGQVGFVGHIEIADQTTFGAQSGIAKSVKESGKTFFGYPAKEHLQALRIEGALRQLPEVLVEFRSLQKRIAELEQLLHHQVDNPNE